ncbi:MAG TPA: VWA domain-containing protein [Bryobacteraceae bacterium]|jgi:VWFA-related protein|nr:VWA domain-containing protein [Bryobacteraceae bacterium]
MLRTTLFLCLAGLLAAQETGTAPRPQPENTSDQPTFRSTFQFVLAPVTVTDRDGDFVPGLTPQDFRLFDNGTPQRITEDVAQHPLSAVVCIQANNDVSAILPQIKKLASVFETLVMGDDGELAVIAYDHRVQTLTGFTSDNAQIDKAFAKLSPGSYTAELNTAALAGINMLKTRPKERRRILIIIGENRDKGSDIKVREVLSEADFANVYIYSVDVSQLVSALTSKAMPNAPSNLPPGADGVMASRGYVNNPTTQSQNDFGNWAPAFKDIFLAIKGVFVPDPLDVYTRYTGGRQFSFKSQKSLEHDIAQLGEELHSQYLLTYSPNNQNEGGWHHIVVEVMRQGLRVRTRDGYYMAARTQ